MKTFISIILIAGAVLSIYYFVNKKNNSEVVVEENVKEDSVNQENQQQGKKMAFSDFVKYDKGSYECTVNQYVEDIESKGVVFVSDGKISGKFISSVNGTNIETNMIVRDGFTYTWTSALAGMGFKSPVAEDENNTNTNTSGSYSWNGNTIGDYDCKEWVLDNSKFEIPQNINFTFVGQ